MAKGSINPRVCIYSTLIAYASCSQFGIDRGRATRCIHHGLRAVRVGSPYHMLQFHSIYPTISGV